MTAAVRQEKNFESGRRPDIETALTDEFQVKWKFFPELATSQFDQEASRANQARFEAIDEPTVDTYADAADRGDEFPGVLAYRPKSNKKGLLVVIDGNHRLAAFDRVSRPIPVYEIAADTAPQTIAVMTYTFNTKHGRPTSEEERIHQALYLVGNGASPSVAAETVNLPLRILTRALVKKRADDRAQEVGLDIRQWDALSQANRSRLLNISTDEAFQDAAQLTFQANLGTDEVQVLVAKVAEGGKSAARQRRIIADEKEAMRERVQQNAGGLFTPKTRAGMTARGKMRTAFGQLNTITESPTAFAKLFAANERVDEAERILEVVAKLEKYMVALNPKLK